MLVEDRARALSAGRCLLEGDDPERPGGLGTERVPMNVGAYRSWGSIGKLALFLCQY